MKGEVLFPPAVLAIVAAAGIALLTPFGMLVPFAIAGVIAGGVLWAYPILAVFVLVGLAPFASLMEIGPITPGKLAGAGGLGVMIGQIAFGQRSLGELATKMWIPIAAMVAITFFGVVFISESPFALAVLRKLITAVILFAIVLYCAPDLKISTATRILVIGGTLPCLAALLIDTSHIENGRATGFQNDPNIFAMFILYTMPLTATLIILEKKWWVRVGLGLALLIQLLSFLEAGSRSGLLVLAASCLILVPMAWRAFRALNWAQRLSLMGAAGVMSLLALAVAPDSYKTRIVQLLPGSTIAEPDRSIGRRASYIEVGAEMIAESPVFGKGPGSFRDRFAESGQAIQYASSKEVESLWRRAHNSYLEITAETGLLGLSAFLALLASVIANFQWVRMKALAIDSPDTFVLASGYLISFVCGAMFLMFLTHHIHEYLWAFAALSVIWRHRLEALSPAVAPTKA